MTSNVFVHLFSVFSSYDADNPVTIPRNVLSRYVYMSDEEWGR